MKKNVSRSCRSSSSSSLSLEIKRNKKKQETALPSSSLLEPRAWVKAKKWGLEAAAELNLQKRNRIAVVVVGTAGKNFSSIHSDPGPACQPQCLKCFSPLCFLPEPGAEEQQQQLEPGDQKKQEKNKKNSIAVVIVGTACVSGSKKSCWPEFEKELRLLLILKETKSRDLPSSSSHAWVKTASFFGMKIKKGRNFSK